MAETYGITPVPIRAAILPQNNRSIFDINALFKAHALKQEDARLKLTESKYAADAMLETHKLFDDFKYLPKDAQTVEEVFTPVNVLMDKGISNLDDAMNVRNEVIKAFNNPLIRKTQLDKRQYEALVKAGEDFKDPLGVNVFKYKDEVDKLARTPGADLHAVNINQFFDTEKANREKLKENAQTAGLEAQTNIYNAQSETYRAQNAANATWTADINKFAIETGMPESARIILADPGNKGKPEAMDILLASELAAKDTTPGLTKQQKWINNYEDVRRAGKYEPTRAAGSSTGITINYGDPLLNATYGSRSNDPVVIPGKTDSAGNQDKADYITKKNPQTGVWTPHPKIVEVKAGLGASNFYTVVGTGENRQVLSINPAIDNNPTNADKDQVNMTDFGVARGNDDVVDMNPWGPTLGGWADAVSVQGTGKTLYGSDMAGMDPWFGKDVTVSRSPVTKGLVIEYPGHDKVPIYFRMVNDKPVDARGENTFGDIETNSLQIVQAHIKKLQATKQMSDEEISKQIIYSTDQAGNPKFTMKNMIFAPRNMSGVTESELPAIKRLDDIGRGVATATTVAPIIDQVPQALTDNYKTNIADTATSKYFTDNQKYLNQHGDSLYGVFQLHPSVLKVLKTATEEVPKLLSVITDFTDDPTRHDLTREGKTSDHHAGLAIDLSVRDQYNINLSLDLIRRLQKTKAVRVVLLEYGSDKERRELTKEIESNTGLIADKEIDGITFKLRPRDAVGATGSNIHVGFRNTVPVTKSQAIFDEAAIGKDSLINTPGFPDSTSTK